MPISTIKDKIKLIKLFSYKL